MINKDILRKKFKIIHVKGHFYFSDKFNYLLNFGLVGSGNKKGGASFKEDSP